MTQTSETGSWSPAQFRLRLFEKQWSRRDRLRRIADLLGPMDSQTCLDIVNDPALSQHLRQTGALQGSRWHSAAGSDSQAAVLRSLVGENVHRLAGTELPFENGAFDLIVIGDHLEYVAADDKFVAECHRVLKSSGRLIVSTPRSKRWCFARSLREMTGLVDKRRSPARAGYTESQLFTTLKDGFDVQESGTYSRFFAEMLEIFGQLMTGYTCDEDAAECGHRKQKWVLRFYSLIYPLYYPAAGLDALLFFTRGYHFIVRAKRRIWVPRRTPQLRDGRSIAEAALQSKIGTAAPF